jgi:hypothetical protein
MRYIQIFECWEYYVCLREYFGLNLGLVLESWYIYCNFLVSSSCIRRRYINQLKSGGNYMFQVSYQSVRLYFCIYRFVCLSLQATIIFLNSINQLIFVMVKCGVLFEVRTEYLNII